MGAKRAHIAFVEVKGPISDPVTKFGGQPVWLEKPQWPLSRSTGLPMKFIGQIRIETELFPGDGLRMAYLFIGEDEDGSSETWQAEGGENALILQPGSGACVEVTPTSTGPSLYRMVEKRGHDRLVPVACEYAVALELGEDPPPPSDEDLATWDEKWRR